jgi:hypothetical protein
LNSIIASFPGSGTGIASAGGAGVAPGSEVELGVTPVFGPPHDPVKRAINIKIVPSRQDNILTVMGLLPLSNHKHPDGPLPKF